MNDPRRTLIEGMKRTVTDPAKAVQFIQEARAGGGAGDTANPTPTTAAAPSSTSALGIKAPFSTRIRADFAAALKKASLQRQIDGIEPSTINDMLEQALEPWLREHGYLS